MNLYTLLMIACLHTDAKTDSERIKAVIAGRYADQPSLTLVQAPQVFAPVDIYSELTPLRYEVSRSARTGPEVPQ